MGVRVGIGAHRLGGSLRRRRPGQSDLGRAHADRHTRRCDPPPRAPLRCAPSTRLGVRGYIDGVGRRPGHQRTLARPQISPRSAAGAPARRQSLTAHRPLRSHGAARVAAHGSADRRPRRWRQRQGPAARRFSVRHARHQRACAPRCLGDAARLHGPPADHSGRRLAPHRCHRARPSRRSDPRGAPKQRVRRASQRCQRARSRGDTRGQAYRTHRVEAPRGRGRFAKRCTGIAGSCERTSATGGRGNRRNQIQRDEFSHGACGWRRVARTVAVPGHPRHAAQDCADQRPRALAARRHQAQLQGRGRLRRGFRRRPHYARSLQGR